MMGGSDSTSQNFRSAMAWMVLVTLLAVSGVPAAAAATAAQQQPPCPAGFVAMAPLVCESAKALHFLNVDGSQKAVVHKRDEDVYDLSGRPPFMGLQEADVSSSSADLLGNLLLKTAAPGDVSWQAVADAVPPSPGSGGGHLDVWDMAMRRTARFRCTGQQRNETVPPLGIPGVDTFTSSRGSSMPLIFNRLGGDVNADGLPSMWQALGKYGKSKAQFKTPVKKTAIKNGLWGDFLPILNFVLPTTDHDCDQVPTTSCSSGCRVPSTSVHPPCKPPGFTCHHNERCCWPCLNGTTPQSTDTGRVEMTVVPLADAQGNRFQRGYYRLLDFAANGTLREARYFDTFAYTGDSVARGRTNGIGSGPDSKAATKFYSEVLAQQSWWALELEREGVLSLELPSDPATNGLTLANQARHSLIRNMITREDYVWPVYGISYNYMHSSAMGF